MKRAAAAPRAPEISLRSDFALHKVVHGICAHFHENFALKLPQADDEIKG
jgi:hypothetical protein